MSNKILLLIVAILAIWIGTSGKGLVIYNVLTGKTPSDGVQKETNPTNFDPKKATDGTVGA